MIMIENNEPTKRNGLSKLTDRQLDWLSVGFLALLVMIFFWQVIFLGHVLLPLDMLYEFEPWKSEAAERPAGPIQSPEISDVILHGYPIADYSRESFARGIPLWDPYALSGMPAFARGYTFTNPVFRFFSLALPAARAMSWTAVLNVFLASVFTFLLLREMGVFHFGALIGSMVFCFNGYIVGFLSFTAFSGSMLWLPAVFWGVERAINRQDWRWAIAGALGFAVQILSGTILWPFYGAITLGIFTLYRSILLLIREKCWQKAVNPLVYAAIALGGGAALASPLLLLMVELFLQTQRITQLGANSFLSKSHAIRLVAPYFFGSPLFEGKFRGQFNYTETDLYFGILSLALIAASVLSRKRALAAGLAGIGLAALLAVYKITPFRQLITLTYPVFLNVFPGRIFYVVAFTWALAAGIGADWLSREGKSVAPRISLATALTGLAVFGLAGLIVLYNHPAANPYLSPIPALRALKAKQPSWLIFSFILFSVSALLIFLWRRPAPRRRLELATLLFLATDLFFFGIRYNPAFSVKWLYPETPSLSYLKNLRENNAQPYRVLTVPTVVLLPGMIPEAFRLETITGYDSLISRRYAEYADLTKVRYQGAIVHLFFNDCCNPLIDALNVRYVYAAAGSIPSGTGALSLLSRLKDASKESSLASVTIHRWELGGLEQPVIYTHPISRVAFDLKITRDAVFKSEIGINPAAWDDGGDGVLFKVFISPAGQQPAGTSRPVFERYLDPKSNPEEQAWLPVQVSLSEFIDQEISLILVTEPGPNQDYAFDWAGWANPRIEGYQPQSLKLIYNGPNKIYENMNALPRAWIVHRLFPAKPGDIVAVKAHLSAENFDPRIEAAVEAPEDMDAIWKNTRVEIPPGESAQVKRYTAEEVEIQATLNQPGLLVLSDAMYPGWKAYVDGAEQPILPTNLIMRGVVLQPGKHQVVFVFRPELLPIGAVISITVFALFAALLTIPAFAGKLGRQKTEKRRRQP